MTSPILNLDALDLQPWGHGVSVPGAGQANDRYQARIGFVGRQLGAKKLGYNSTVLPPGKSAFPFHCPSSVDGKPRELHFMGRATESLEYWQGE